MQLKTITKIESTRPVNFDALAGIFQQALDHLDDRCAKDPSLLDRHNGTQSNKLTGQIDRLWLLCQQGKASLNDFKAAVREWERAAVYTEGLV